jgi:hypothetical protein
MKFDRAIDIVADQRVRHGEASRGSEAHLPDPVSGGTHRPPGA